MTTAMSEKSQASTMHADPSKIMQIGMGFWASKVVLTAVKLQLFTILAKKPSSAKEIKSALKLGTTERHVYDWLDTLVSLGFLKREGLLDSAVYSNAEDTHVFLDKNKPSYIGGILEMANNRLYRFWNDLEEALITGNPQNEVKSDGNMDFFMTLYKDEDRLQEFMDAMTGIQMGNFMTLVKKFDFGRYKTIADIGGADGSLSIQICREHPNVSCINYDLPPVAPVARKKISKMGLEERIKVEGGDMMKDPLPAAQVICMGNILHGFDEENKKMMAKKVFEILPEGGAFIVIENIIDNERKQNTFGLLMSLNMLIENGSAYDSTYDDFQKLTAGAGFVRHELISLTGPTSAAVAYK
jgi:hypothetical protein